MALCLTVAGPTMRRPQGDAKLPTSNGYWHEETGGLVGAQTQILPVDPWRRELLLKHGPLSPTSQRYSSDSFVPMVSAPEAPIMVKCISLSARHFCELTSMVPHQLALTVVLGNLRGRLRRTCGAHTCELRWAKSPFANR